MSARQVALPTAIVTIVAGAFSILQAYAPLLLRETWLPGLSVIVLLGTTLNFLLNPGVILGVAYWASGGADVPRKWSLFGAWTFAAAVIGYFVGGAIGLGIASLGSDHALLSGNPGVYLNVGMTALFGGVRAALAGVAGASIGHFRLN